jgi:hypothetical protein
MSSFRQKNVWAALWAIFFTSSSGHPARSLTVT